MIKNHSTVSGEIARNRAGIMGLAMMFIMIYHQVWFVDGMFWEFFNKTGRWGVDIFMFVSGYGIANSLTKNSLKVYYNNRLTRLLPACVISGIVQTLLDVGGVNGGTGFPVVLTCLGMYKWFIFAVLIFYAISPLFYSMLKHYGGYVFALAFIGVIILRYYHCFEQGNTIYTTLSKIIERFPAYLYGMYFFFLKETKIDKKWSVVMTMGSFFYTVAIYCVYNNIWISGMRMEILALVPALPMLCLLLAFVSKFLIFATSVGTISLELYLWHEYIYRAVSRQSLINSSVLQLVMALFLSFIVAYSLHRVIGTIKYYKK